jgi:hypothetical protein
MSALEADNVFLGYTPVSNAADEITIPEGAIRGLVANMAQEVAPDYGIAVSAELAKQAMDGLRVMRLLGRARVQTAYPAGLPMGHGREDSTLHSSAFYNVQARAVLHLINNDGLLALTSSDGLLTTFPSAGEDVDIRGYWDIGESVGLMADITGRVRNTTGKRLHLTVKATLNAVAFGAGDYGVFLLNSGVPGAPVIQTATTSPDTLAWTINQPVEVEPEGVLLLRAINFTGTDSLRFFNCRLEVS